MAQIIRRHMYNLVMMCYNKRQGFDQKKKHFHTFLLQNCHIRKENTQHRLKWEWDTGNKKEQFWSNPRLENGFTKGFSKNHSRLVPFHSKQTHLLQKESRNWNLYQSIQDFAELFFCNCCGLHEFSYSYSTSAYSSWDLSLWLGYNRDNSHLVTADTFIPMGRLESPRSGWINRKTQQRKTGNWTLWTFSEWSSYKVWAHTVL